MCSVCKMPRMSILGDFVFTRVTYLYAFGTYLEANLMCVSIACMINSIT